MLCFCVCVFGCLLAGECVWLGVVLVGCCVV